MPKESWDAAGLTGPDLHLDRRVPTGEYFVPTGIRLKGELLSWNAGTFDQHNMRNANTAPLLDRFLRLAEAPADRVLKFAQEWGPLDIRSCVRMRFGRGEKKIDEFILAFLDFPVLTMNARSSWKYDSEPIAFYSAMALKIRCHLDLAGEIFTDGTDRQTWEARYPLHCEECSYGVERAVEQVDDFSRRLLQLGDVTVRPDWNGKHWDIQIVTFNLLAVLAVKFLAAIARVDCLALCAGCKHFYSRSGNVDATGTVRPRRAPRAGENNYCSDCGRPRALQVAKRRLRLKQRRAQELYQAGSSPSEIAKLVDTTPKIVNGWKKKAGWVKN